MITTNLSLSRVFTAALIVCAFIAGVAAGRYWIVQEQKQTSNPSPAADAVPRMKLEPGQRVVGFLDMHDGKPAISAASGNEVQIAGWAACVERDSPVARLEILVDGRMVGTGRAGSPRPDVAEAYSRSDFANSGWNSSFRADGLAAGEHELMAEVTCANGDRGRLPAFRLTITAP